MKPVGLDNPRDADPRALALCGGPAAAGQQARHAVEHGRLPDQAEARRAGAAVPHHSRARERRVRAARRAAPQHLPQLADAARPPAAAEERAAYPLRRADHRLRRLCRKRRRGPDGRADGGRRAGGPRLGSPAAHHRDGRAARAHHRRCRGRELSADERQFRPVPAAARSEEEAAQGSLHRARQGRFRRVAGGKRPAPLPLAGGAGVGQSEASALTHP